jgi:non-ribosomal peptide synthase protein (TIGR01720 family)
MLRVLSFDLGPDRPGRLLMVVHHLACDAASWPILLEDLATTYARLQRGDPIALPPKTSSYLTWAARLAAFAAAPERARDRAFWERECAMPGARLRRERTGTPAIADAVLLGLELEPDATDALVRAAAAARVTVDSMLLTALALAVTADGIGDDDALLVYLERHGRAPLGPDVDVSRTVGWFTAVFPVAVRVAPDRDPGATLAGVHRHLSEVPDDGIAWGAMVYGRDASDHAAALGGLPRPEVSLNYLGRIDPPAGAGWCLAPESAGRELGRGGTRPTVLDVVAELTGGRLRIAWHYDAFLLAAATIERCAARFHAVLRELAAGPIDGRPTP